MAANAVKFVIIDHPVRGNFAHKFPVAEKAIRVQNLGIPRLDADRIPEIPESERAGMVVAVTRLRYPLEDKILR